jgi:hypothetical protein
VAQGREESTSLFIIESKKNLLYRKVAALLSTSPVDDSLDIPGDRNVADVETAPTQFSRAALFTVVVMVATHRSVAKT